MACARSRATSVIAASILSASRLEAMAGPRPVAISMNESLVEVSPSTLMQLNERSATRSSMSCNTLRGTAASVATKPSMVAMSGRIMPAPFAMPVTCAWPFESFSFLENALGTVSVVMMASAADSQSLFASSAFGSAATMRSAGSRSMITPVENGSTSSASQPRCDASASHTCAARFRPSSPVPALALPVLTTSAWMSFFRCFFARMTGAAQKRLRVNTPATALPDARRRTSKSLRPGFFTPAIATPSSTPAMGWSNAGSGAGRLTARVSPCFRNERSLPVCGFVVLQELPPYMLAGVDAGDDRIDDARRPVHDVERRVEALLARLARRDLHRILVRHPAGVYAVHVDTVVPVVGRRGARHHVERRLRHVGVRMARGLEVAVELPLHRRHIDDVLVALRRAQHQFFQSPIQYKRGDAVDQLHLEQLHRRHLRQRKPPRVAPAQVHLLQVLVEHAFGKESLGLEILLRQQARLRPLRGVCRPRKFSNGYQQSLRRSGQRSPFPLDHVLVELRRPPHRLARIVDDEVEPRAPLQQLPAERLHARRMAQIQPEDLQPVPPVVEIRLARIPPRRIPRKPRRHDQLGPAAKQFEPGLIADLHPPTGQQRHAPVQIRQFGALAEIQLGAGRAQLVVEMMQLRVLRLARIAMPLDLGAGFEVRLRSLLRREHVRRREHRLPAQRPDPRRVQHVLLALGLRRALRPPRLLQPAPAYDAVRVMDRRFGLLQALAVFCWQ